MTQIAVVILNYNGEKLLPQFLPSVIQYSDQAEIIVIDNASTDQSISILKRDFPTVRLIELKSNFGFCGGYNRGLLQVEATYYVLLNSDIEVTQGWLQPMFSLFEDDPLIAAMQPKVLSYREKNKFEYAGAGGGYIDALAYPFCRGRLFDHLEEDKGQYNDSRQIFWATGACLMIRSSVFREFGGLDEYFFAHMEEIDLCWKINRTDQKVYYCGQSHVYHVGAGTLGYESPRKTYLNFRNGLILLYKHFDTAELWYKLPVRMMLDWVAALQFLTKRKGKNAVAVLEAHAHFLKDITQHSRQRKAIQNRYPYYSRKNIHRGLIIIDYFLKGRKVIDP